MHFLYPSFLFALFAIAIPVIIHLFYFHRHKTVYFTNVRFLKAVQEQTSTRSNLKQLLILLSRILTVLFLVFAFAQPYIPVENKKDYVQGKIISIYLDNSYSMHLLSEHGSLLDEAKRKVREILKVYDATYKFQLITNDFEWKHNNPVNKEQILYWLDEVKASANVKQISHVITRQRQFFSKEKLKKSTLYLISDFQKQITDVKNFEKDSSLMVYLIPLKSNQQENIYIDSCWFATPIPHADQIIKLIVRLKSSYTTSMDDLQLTLKIDNKIKAIANINFNEREKTLFSNKHIIDTLSFSVKEIGWHSAVLSINDYPITFDDSYYFAFNITHGASILCINSGAANKYLQALYEKEDYFIYKNSFVNQLDYSSFPKYQLIILNELKTISTGLASELKKYIEQGGDLVIFPDYNTDTYRNFLSSLKVNYYIGFDEKERYVASINTDAAIFKDVFEEIPDNIDLPLVKKRLLLTDKVKINEEKLLSFKNNSAFITKYLYGKGKIYLSTVPINVEYSNLPIHAIFVPMMYNITLLSGNMYSSAYTIGKDEVIEIDAAGTQSEDMFVLKKDDLEIIPEQKILTNKTILLLHNQIGEAGIFQLYSKKTPRFNALAGFNYDRKESDLTCYEIDKLMEYVAPYGYQVLNTMHKNISKLIADTQQYKRLWKLCIIFALLFIAMEILLIKLWR